MGGSCRRLNLNDFPEDMPPVRIDATCASARPDRRGGRHRGGYIHTTKPRDPCQDHEMSLMLKMGERFEMKGRTLTVTPTAFECLPRVRTILIEAARSGETVTYSEMHDQLDLPYAVNGMGRLLDLLSEDCIRRREPSLAAIVVNATTGEVGEDFAGDPVAERALVFAQRHWS